MQSLCDQVIMVHSRSRIPSNTFGPDVEKNLGIHIAYSTSNGSGIYKGHSESHTTGQVHHGGVGVEGNK